MTGGWFSLCFLTGTSEQFEVMGAPGTSFSIYSAMMKGRKLFVISLDVNFIDDTFYIGYLSDLQGVLVAACLVYVTVNSPLVDQERQHTRNVDGYINLLIENWLQSERWFDLCPVS
ncbi:hypothetical protein AMTR_s00036p00045550 [Amborella trichopoda]|uniref:Uncharacterized protein n=2 Tax=Amborella trichopoda TaxID=13333 RepID=U5CZ88_AMBTC|nr:hypothetical protein AMTR_s00036p00045550 [Amborella trichopoda]